MADASVISRPLTKPRELNQGGTSTTKTVFSVDGTEPVICYIPTPQQLGTCNRFKVRAWGTVVTSGTLNFTISLQYGTSITATSNSDIEDSGTTSLASLTTHWMIEAWLIWDSSSDRIDGVGWSQVHTTFDALATIDTPITSIDLNSTTSSVGFVVAGTFGTGAAGNSATLAGFEIEK